MTFAGDALAHDGWAHRTGVVNGCRAHWVTAGEGPLVLLLHSASGGWFSWRHQIDPIVQLGYTVVALDRRGFGRSAKPADVEAYAITTLIDDCVALVHELGFHNSIVIGHDWGAIVAWSAAWLRPDMFRAVAGLAVPFGGAAQLPVAGASTLGEQRPRDAWRIITDNDPDVMFYVEYRSIPGQLERDVEHVLGEWAVRTVYASSADGLVENVPDLATADGSAVLDYTRRTSTCIHRSKGPMGPLALLPARLPAWLIDDAPLYAAEFERTGIDRTFNYYRAMDLNWELLSQSTGAPVSVPALYIGGDKDIGTVWGVEAISRFNETVPDLVESVILPGVGHWMPLEDPVGVNSAIARFVRQVDW